MPQNYLTRIPRLYRLIAPVYTPLRPLWTRTLSRAVEVYLEQIALPPCLNAAAVVLDLGCGPGSNLARLQRLGLPFAHYVGFDLSPAMLAARRVPGSTLTDFVQGDSYRLPFAKDSFDVILSTWMFSHLHKPTDVVCEAQRLLRPNGRLIVACVTRPPGLVGVLLRRIGKTLLMDCLPSEEINAWPGIDEFETFLGGCSVVASLRKIC